MARSCIYCGRTLAPGEKCQCRAAGTASQQNPSAKAETEGRREDERKQGKPSGQTQGQSRSHTKQTRSRPFFTGNSQQRREAFQKRLPGLLAVLHSASRYLSAPVEVIRDHVYRPSRKRSVGFHGFLAIVSGLMLVRLASRARLAGWPVMNLTEWHPALQFITGVMLATVTVLLLGGVYSLLLKYIHRRPYPYATILSALAPSSLYAGLLMLFASGSVRSAPISAAMMFLVGQSAGLIAQFFAMRQMTAFDENRLVVLVLSAAVLASSLLGMILPAFF